MNGKVVGIIAVICLILIGIGVFLATSGGKPQYSNLDSFAKCLADKKVTMYGAYWCPHCQNTKKEFGSSFQYVPYVECTVETKTCSDQNINGYPTWTFPDGTRIEGEASLQDISAKSNCPLPK